MGKVKGKKNCGERNKKIWTRKYCYKKVMADLKATKLPV